MSTDSLISPLDLELDDDAEAEARREIEEFARWVFTKGLAPSNQHTNQEGSK